MRSVIVFPFAAVLLFAIQPQAALAQTYPADSALDATQKIGRDLFTGHCMVCHEHTQISLADHFGPDISGRSLGGRDDALVAQISNGSPNMPGFKYVFDEAQIRAIVAYVKSLPTPVHRAQRDEKTPEGDRHAD
jgi:mono/diheme cytochrome c family protein